ncbi:MAG TPA: hypothetical protein VJ673_02665 [Aromatoleum sp.]|uniref:hypothetical protein n=1 Tax=Aromatoleum sp. TaxID=2307007 RepID=UPI002B49DDED|nr:hypothetical protein [Aromatoleum sp.]HJV24555.1 hypothetical protein [Aromatoleum sp.]
MRAVLLSLFVLILAGCSGSGALIRQIDTTRPPSVYVEPMDGDGFGLQQKIESYLAMRGYDPVSDPSKASMRLKARYQFAATDTSATVRITDAATGDSIYYGEGNNHGFGTLMNPGGAIFGCFERAMSDLPRR